MAARSIRLATKAPRARGAQGAYAKAERTAEKAEEALLKKLAYSGKNKYLARVAFAEGDYETFEAALNPYRETFQYTPTKIGTVKYNPKECGDDDDNDDSDDDESLYCPSSMR